MEAATGAAKAGRSLGAGTDPNLILRRNERCHTKYRVIFGNPIAFPSSVVFFFGPPMLPVHPMPERPFRFDHSQAGCLHVEKRIYDRKPFCF